MQVRGIFKINGKELMTLPYDPELQKFEKEIKKALIDLGTAYNFDYDNDSVSIEYDLGEGFHATYFKTKLLKN